MKTKRARPLCVRGPLPRFGQKERHRLILDPKIRPLFSLAQKGNRMARARTDFDVVVAGGGFAGLVAATSIAARGLRVAVLEAKNRFGARIHTTGLLVKEAAEELDIPTALTRKIHGVRIYAPNLRCS